MDSHLLIEIRAGCCSAEPGTFRPLAPPPLRSDAEIPTSKYCGRLSYGAGRPKIFTLRFELKWPRCDLFTEFSGVERNLYAQGGYEENWIFTYPGLGMKGYRKIIIFDSTFKYLAMTQLVKIT